MPLHVNLYHEIQRQELDRRRDPLRLGMLAVLVIAVGFIANYCVLLERSHSIGIRYSSLQGEWSTLESKAKDAKARQDDLDAEIKASDTMMKSVNSRFYWAPVLGEILNAVPRSIQLTHLGADVPADDTAINSVVTISGIASSTEPRKEAENIRTALNARLAAQFKNVTSVFKNLDDSDQFVMLEGRRLPTALFSLEFQIQVRDPVAVAAPAPARKPKAAATE
jgi:Tfp pilus assembly protein PilN